MEKQTFACPSCGGTLELKYRFSKMAVCGYCNQTSFVENGQLKLAGDKNELANYGSKLSLAAKGTLIGKNFMIIGHVRFEYFGGFWDEWLVDMDGQTDEFWIHEDEGDLILYTKMETKSIPDYQEFKIGTAIEFVGKRLFPTEKNKAQILGGEGELPYRVLPNQQADFVDGIFYGEGTVFSFKFLPEETQFYKGQFIKWDDIVIEKAENPYSEQFK